MTVPFPPGSSGWSIVERLQGELADALRRYEEAVVDAKHGHRVASERIAQLEARVAELEGVEPWRRKPPVDLVLHCPACGKQHIDVGEFRTRVHRKHLCEDTPEGAATGCGCLWVPFEYATRGVMEVLKPEDS